jgi:hypothetical protein
MTHGGGRGGWGSENTHKIRSAFLGMAPGKPLCITIINLLFCFLFRVVLWECSGGKEVVLGGIAYRSPYA